MKLWVDDVSPATGHELDLGAGLRHRPAWLLHGTVSVVPLDHDLAEKPADGRERTGYDLALLLAERACNGDPVPRQVYVHSANPVGRARITAVVARYLTGGTDP